MSLPLFNELLNRAIALDPAAPVALAALSGTVISVHLDGVGLDFQILVTGDHLGLAPGPAAVPGAADASIHATPLALLKMLRSDDPARALFDGEVRVDGRRDRVQRLSAILQGLDIDWEEQLSRLVGDLAARQIGNRVRAGRDWGRGVVESLRLDLREYLLDEVHQLVRPEQLADFATAVDRVRDDVARLEARVQRAERRRKGHSET